MGSCDDGSVCGDNTGSGDDLMGSFGSDEVEECLCRAGQLGVTLGDQHEGTLDGVSLVLDRFLNGRNAADPDGLDGVLDGSQRSVTDGAGVLGYSGDHVAGGSQLLTVLAQILNANDLLEAAPGAGTSLTTNQDDLCVNAADLIPVASVRLMGIEDGGSLLFSRILQPFCVHFRLNWYIGVVSFHSG